MGYGKVAIGLVAFVCCAVLAVGCGPITDLQLARFRNDHLIENHRYALGERYLDAGGVRFCYQDLGQGDALLILPGLGTNIDYWQKNVAALAKEHRVITIDLPGFGKSSKPDVGYDLLWICDRILDFMDAKQLRRVSVMGISMGGHLGLLLALDHPERIEKLIMVGSCGVWEKPGFLLDFVFHSLGIEWSIADHLRRNWYNIFRRLIVRPTSMTDTLLGYQMAILANRTKYAAQGRASARALRSIFYNTCRHRLGDVTQPALLLWGEGDFIHPPKDGAYMRDHLPGSRLVVFPDANHAVMIDKPDEFNRQVLEFLRNED